MESQCRLANNQDMQVYTKVGQQAMKRKKVDFQN